MGAVIILDTECTDKKEPEPIEAAWGVIRCEPLDAVPPEVLFSESYSGRFRPTRPVSYGAMAVHHILPSELEGAPSFATAFVLPEDLEYMVGHSIDFDWQAIGSPPVKRICTHAIAQHVWPEATGYSQSALLYMLLGATPATRERLKGAHGALQDVVNNAILLEHILAMKPEIRTWAALWEFSEECRIPRTCPMKRYEGVPLEHLDYGFINWCLNQGWLDPYFRKGLNRVLEARERAGRLEPDDDLEDYFREVAPSA